MLKAPTGIPQAPRGGEEGERALEILRVGDGGAPGGAGRQGGKETRKMPGPSSGRPWGHEYPRMRLQLMIFKEKIKNCSNIHLGKQVGKRPWSGTAGNRLGGERGGHISGSAVLNGGLLSPLGTNLWEALAAHVTECLV